MSTNLSGGEALGGINAVLSSVHKGSGDLLSESERVAALNAATKLVASLEKPEDASLKFAYMVCLTRTCTQVPRYTFLTLCAASRSMDGHQNSG
jgi:hypothetical protein